MTHAKVSNQSHNIIFDITLFRHFLRSISFERGFHTTAKICAYGFVIFELEGKPLNVKNNM